MPLSHRLPRPEPEHRSGSAPNGLTYESVWDYPRPPKVEREPRTVLVKTGRITIASSEHAIRVCETAGAPVVYVPVDDVDSGVLRPSSGHASMCEWKGPAAYFDVIAEGEEILHAAWAYPRPWQGFERITGHLAFYPGLVECRLAGELVRPQPGGFYGGWVTDEITGPIKGTPGSQGW
ncbi:MAG: DUF427 domain-containing protein [Solirubrobacterales bacterium]